MEPLTCNEVIELFSWHLASHFEGFVESHPRYPTPATVSDAFRGHIGACDSCHEKLMALHLYIHLAARYMAKDGTSG